MCYLITPWIFDYSLGAAGDLSVIIYLNNPKVDILFIRKIFLNN